VWALASAPLPFDAATHAMLQQRGKKMRQRARRGKELAVGTNARYNSDAGDLENLLKLSTQRQLREHASRIGLPKSLEERFLDASREEKVLTDLQPPVPLTKDSVGCEIYSLDCLADFDLCPVPGESVPKRKPDLHPVDRVCAYSDDCRESPTVNFLEGSTALVDRADGRFDGDGSDSFARAPRRLGRTAMLGSTVEFADTGHTDASSCQGTVVDMKWPVLVVALPACTTREVDHGDLIIIARCAAERDPAGLIQCPAHRLYLTADALWRRGMAYMKKLFSDFSGESLRRSDWIDDPALCQKGTRLLEVVLPEQLKRVEAARRKGKLPNAVVQSVKDAATDVHNGFSADTRAPTFETICMVALCWGLEVLVDQSFEYTRGMLHVMLQSRIGKNSEGIAILNMFLSDRSSLYKAGDYRTMHQIRGGLRMAVGDCEGCVDDLHMALEYGAYEEVHWEKAQTHMAMNQHAEAALHYLRYASEAHVDARLISSTFVGLALILGRNTFPQTLLIELDKVLVQWHVALEIELHQARHAEVYRVADKAVAVLSLTTSELGTSDCAHDQLPLGQKVYAFAMALEEHHEFLYGAADLRDGSVHALATGIFGPGLGRTMRLAFEKRVSGPAKSGSEDRPPCERSDPIARQSGKAPAPDALHSSCATCGSHCTETKPLMRCTGCSSVWYCSRECQAADWKVHRSFCKLLQGSREGSLAGPEADSGSAADQTQLISSLSSSSHVPADCTFAFSSADEVSPALSVQLCEKSAMKQCSALRQYLRSCWQHHAHELVAWWMGQDVDGRTALLRRVSPDIPTDERDALFCGTVDTVEYNLSVLTSDTCPCIDGMQHSQSSRLLYEIHERGFACEEDLEKDDYWAVASSLIVGTLPPHPSFGGNTALVVTDAVTKEDRHCMYRGNIWIEKESNGIASHVREGKIKELGAWRYALQRRLCIMACLGLVLEYFCEDALGQSDAGVVARLSGCSKCGGDCQESAAVRCPRCAIAWWCGPSCQSADTGHLKVCCGKPTRFTVSLGSTLCWPASMDK